jgi:putative sterol carrier protein
MPTFDSEKLIQFVKDSFISENSTGVNTRIQVDLCGEGGGEWYMMIKEQSLDIQTGKAENADAEISISVDDFLGLLSGDLDPLRAFFSGRVRISGDQSAVIKLMSVFKVDAEYLAKLRGL